MSTSKLVCVTSTAFCLFPILAKGANEVSVQILSNGQNSMTVQPGTVDLQLDLRMSTNIGLMAAQFTLDCSDPTKFVYADPTVTVGTPFTEDDMAFIPIDPPADDGVPLADYPLVTFFRMRSGNYEPAVFPSVIFSFHVRSATSLTAGTTYSFTLQDTGDFPLWMNSLGGGDSITGKILVGTDGTFTLRVAGESGGDTTTGDGGTTPGDGGTTTGDGGTTTGDGGTTPGDGGTTTGDGGATTGDGGTTTGDGGTTPGDGGTTPGDGGTTPGDGGTTPSGGTDQPSEGTSTTTPTTPVALCGSGVGFACMLGTTIGLWLIAPRSRATRRVRPRG